MDKDVEYYSARKKNKILPFTTMWMDLEGIMLGEISQTEKRQILYDLTYMWNLKKPSKLIDTEIMENRLVAARGGVGEWVKWVKGVKRYKLLVIK